jgi:hypothetical protein
VRRLLLTCAFGALSSSAALAEEPVLLGTIIIDGRTVANCLPTDAAREEGDSRPVCVGRGQGRDDLPGATIDASQFDALPTGSTCAPARSRKN